MRHGESFHLCENGDVGWLIVTSSRAKNC